MRVPMRASFREGAEMWADVATLASLGRVRVEGHSALRGGAAGGVRFGSGIGFFPNYSGSGGGGGTRTSGDGSRSSSETPPPATPPASYPDGRDYEVTSWFSSLSEDYENQVGQDGDVEVPVWRGLTTTPPAPSPPPPSPLPSARTATTVTDTRTTTAPPPAPIPYKNPPPDLNTIAGANELETINLQQAAKNQYYDNYSQAVVDNLRNAGYTVQYTNRSGGQYTPDSAGGLLTVARQDVISVSRGGFTTSHVVGGSADPARAASEIDYSHAGERSYATGVKADHLLPYQVAGGWLNPGATFLSPEYGQGGDDVADYYAVMGRSTAAPGASSPVGNKPNQSVLSTQPGVVWTPKGTTTGDSLSKGLADQADKEQAGFMSMFADSGNFALLAVAGLAVLILMKGGK